MKKDFKFRGNSSRFGSGRNSGGRFSGNRSGGRDRAIMHNAVCANCGRNCQVPFKPTGNRAVFCSNCFDKDGDNDRRNNSRNFNRDFNSNRSSGRDNRFGEKQMFEAVCDKCGRDCEVPFRPTGEKPIYCSDCFSNTNGRYDDNDNRQSRNSFKTESTDSIKNIQNQIETLNKRIDDLYNLFSNLNKEVIVSTVKNNTIELPVSEIKEPVKKAKTSTSKKTIKKSEKKSAKKPEKSLEKKPAKKVKVRKKA